MCSHFFQPEWQVVRLGLEQLFSALSGTTRFSKIENNLLAGDVRNISVGDTSKQYLGAIVFPEALSPGDALDLPRVFQQIRQEVINMVPFNLSIENLVCEPTLLEF